MGSARNVPSRAVLVTTSELADRRIGAKGWAKYANPYTVVASQSEKCPVSEQICYACSTIAGAGCSAGVGIPICLSRRYQRLPEVDR